jgi:LPXTG-motif cell wall-anchored protein
MKKSVLVFLMASLSLISGLNVVFGQDQPQPKKDTVNIDTDAKPTFYYAAEEEASKLKGGSSTIFIIAGVVVVAAVGGFILLRKKKK